MSIGSRGRAVAGLRSAGCGTGCGTKAREAVPGVALVVESVPRFACQSPTQQKTPRRGGEAFLGLLQGGEICISIYVDPWEVGGPLCAAGRVDGSQLPYERRQARPGSFVCPLSIPSRESLNQDTNIRAICV